jgi:RecB family endonuclease NucS
VKPLNWMTPPTVVELQHDAEGALASMTVRKQRQEDRLEIVVAEVLSDIEHELDTLASLEKEGLERELQELLADAPGWCGEGLRLVRREWPTDIGPVDLMCRDGEDEWVAVEIKRIATIDAVEQLTRYLERIRLDPALGSCRGILVAQRIKPQARVLAQARGIDCVEVDLEVLRGEREPELTLFAG